MQSHLNTVQQAINLHLLQVEIDEASFDENGNPKDEALARATGAAEVFAFKDFVAVECRNEADVQAKVEYVLNGTIGQRTPLIECLFEEEYGGIATQALFLRSLLTMGAK